jgi:plasmid maintenance system killer protein
MEVVFVDKSLKDLFLSGKEKGKPLYGKELVRSFIKKITILMAASNSRDLVNFKSLHLEALVKEKKYKGMHSIRVNDQYRLILRFIKSPEPLHKVIVEVTEIHQLTDYH